MFPLPFMAHHLKIRIIRKTYMAHTSELDLFFHQANRAREPMRLGALPIREFYGASVSEEQPKKDDHRNWHTQQPEQYASTHVLLPYCGLEIT